MRTSKSKFIDQKVHAKALGPGSGPGALVSDQLRDYRVRLRQSGVHVCGRRARSHLTRPRTTIAVCKQGVRGSSPLGSTPSQRRFRGASGSVPGAAYSKLQQRSRIPALVTQSLRESHVLVLEVPWHQDAARTRSDGPSMPTLTRARALSLTIVRVENQARKLRLGRASDEPLHRRSGVGADGDLAGRDLRRGEQGGGAVPNVVKGAFAR